VKTIAIGCGENQNGTNDALQGRHEFNKKTISCARSAIFPVSTFLTEQRTTSSLFCFWQN
ncbi:hypothetical protein L9F63_015304, partial [Diploptera punctata]